MSDRYTIEIWGAQQPHGKGKSRAAKVKPDEVAENLSKAITPFLTVLDKLPQPAQLKMDTMELSFGVTAKGTIGLISKLELGATAGIKVLFKRQ